MHVAAFETTCLNCNEIFLTPRLSDFCYGEFIFGCHCGKAFAYHTTFDPLTTIFDLLCHIHQNDRLDNNSLYDFSCYFADKINGHQLSNKIVCQKCKSTNLSIEIKKAADWDIPETSYSTLYSLSKDELLEAFNKFLESKTQKNDYLR